MNISFNNIDSFVPIADVSIPTAARMIIRGNEYVVEYSLYFALPTSDAKIPEITEVMVDTIRDLDEWAFDALGLSEEESIRRENDRDQMYAEAEAMLAEYYNCKSVEKNLHEN
jgi:hypothetical protein